MLKEIINSIQEGFGTCLVRYTLTISDGSTISVLACPRIDTTSVVRSTYNLREVERSEDDDVYFYRNRYYRYIPISSKNCG